MFTIAKWNSFQLTVHFWLEWGKANYNFNWCERGWTELGIRCIHQSALCTVSWLRLDHRTAALAAWPMKWPLTTPECLSVHAVHWFNVTVAPPVTLHCSCPPAHLCLSVVKVGLRFRPIVIPLYSVHRGISTLIFYGLNFRAELTDYHNALTWAFVKYKRLIIIRLQIFYHISILSSMQCSSSSSINQVITLSNIISY